MVNKIMKKNKLNNKILKKKYEDIYKLGAYQKYFTFNSFVILKAIMDQIPSWSGLDVLDFGCGEGDLAAMLSFAGARNVHAIDYSPEAIKISKKRIRIPNVRFELLDGKDVKKKYDTIVMAGVLEHIDEPFSLLKKLIKNNLKKDGMLISASPSFMNPRGYVWMTLQILLNVPMSLSDVHFFSPTDFEKFGKKNQIKVSNSTIAHDWGGGHKTIIDYKKRLVNALKDAKLNNHRVPEFLKWFEDALQFFDHNDLSGAIMITKFSKKN